MSDDAQKFFLPYQRRWLADKSRLKIWEKSRRIGATYVQAYEDVRDCAVTPNYSVWFSSADESAAKEYILYCTRWAKVLHLAAKDLGEQLLDEKHGVKALVLELENGSRLHGLRSNPKAFRSKGGKVVLDEFAFHDDPDALWKAAKPAITWGFPLRVLSTHNGKNCRYFRFIEDAKKGRGGWSLHSTPIQTAVNEGLADRIAGKALTSAEREDWLLRERESCQDDETWLQEYCCVPVDEASAFLPYDLMAPCESECLTETLPKSGLYLGMDIGRKRDLSVISVGEMMGDTLWVRNLTVIEKAPFSLQREILFSFLPHVARACIDATGLGMQLAEEAVSSFGEYRVEAITFSGPVKEALAFGLRRRFDDRTIRIPADHDLREDLHSVRKLTTAAGNIRFDAERGNAGHADRFTAISLCCHAASTPAGVIEFASTGERRASAGAFGGHDNDRTRKYEGWQ